MRGLVKVFWGGEGGFWGGGGGRGEGDGGKAEKAGKAWIPLPSQGMTVLVSMGGRRLFTALRFVHGYRETAKGIE